MREKIMTLSDDYDLKLVIIPNRDLLTWEMHARYPLAQHPRWQRLTQITGSKTTIWEIGSWLHNEVRTATGAFKTV